MAVVEYMMAELVELAGNCAKASNKKRIIPRHINLAVSMDDELNALLKGAGVIMPQSGVVPGIHRCLLKKADGDTFRGWNRMGLSQRK